MSVLSLVKDRVEKLPVGLGTLLARTPFTLRLGLGYARAVWAIRSQEEGDRNQFEAEQFARLRALVRAAYDSIEFYRGHYQKAGFLPDHLRSLEDWQRVPVVTKADLQGVPLEARTSPTGGGTKINTGGTSGQPLEFYLDDKAFAREWAHMHYIWKARGYRQEHLKITFRGKHFSLQESLRYNAVHNEYVVNANAPMLDVARAVLSLPRESPPRWLHGYPSLIAEFSHALEDLQDQEVARFRTQLFGVLLGSEYPAPVYRSVIERVLSTNIVSWYGHSEMALLARETSQGIYASLPTYGYAETVRIDESPARRLVCTSLHNRIHPFIRYDTGDLVEPIFERHGSLLFRIAEGRIGDFVHDRSGRRHSLTAIIFGRHHAAFELLRHVQVREDSQGCVTLVVTPRESGVDRAVLLRGFDLDDLDIEWRLEVVEAPVRTQAGKIRLKIS